VQILVVVAYIQVRTLKAEEEKGFMRTANDHELAGPNAQINFGNEAIGTCVIKFASCAERETG